MDLTHTGRNLLTRIRSAIPRASLRSVLFRNPALSAAAAAALLDNIKELDRKVLHAARGDATARLFMSVPGIGPITALSVASTFDDASRFKRSSSAGAYLGLTPRRYESGRGEPEWADLQARQQDDTQAPLRGGNDNADPNDNFLLAESLGPETFKKSWPQKGSGRPRPKAGGRASCHVENKHPVPLGCGCRLISDHQHRSISTARPCRDAWHGSGRPTECRSLLRR